MIWRACMIYVYILRYRRWETWLQINIYSYAHKKDTHILSVARKERDRERHKAGSSMPLSVVYKYPILTTQDDWWTISHQCGTRDTVGDVSTGEHTRVKEERKKMCVFFSFFFFFSPSSSDERHDWLVCEEDHSTSSPLPRQSDGRAKVSDDVRVSVFSTRTGVVSRTMPTYSVGTPQLPQSRYVNTACIYICVCLIYYHRSYARVCVGTCVCVCIHSESLYTRLLVLFWTVVLYCVLQYLYLCV